VPELDRTRVRSQNGRVTVCVNGSTDATAALARTFARTRRVPTTVAVLEVADKANATNAFLYELRPPAAVYFFVDGYAEVAPGSLRALAAALDRRTRQPTPRRASRRAAEARRRTRLLSPASAACRGACTRCAAGSSSAWSPGGLLSLPVPIGWMGSSARRRCSIWTRFA
jgi:hypothetical protein